MIKLSYRTNDQSLQMVKWRYWPTLSSLSLYSSAAKKGYTASMIDYINFVIIIRVSKNVVSFKEIRLTIQKCLPSFTWFFSVFTPLSKELWCLLFKSTPRSLGILISLFSSPELFPGLLISLTPICSTILYILLARSWYLFKFSLCFNSTLVYWTCEA